ncbi:hypothetical protein RUND412_000949 [Rhizina undulata]
MYSTLRKHKYSTRAGAANSQSSDASGSGAKQMKSAEFAMDQGAKRPQPFSFEEERWLFLHVTGNYPRESMKKDWVGIATAFSAHFTESRSPTSLKIKWDELMMREITIKYFDEAAKSTIPTARPKRRIINSQTSEGEDSSARLAAESGDESFEDNIASLTVALPASEGLYKRYSEGQIQWLLNWGNGTKWAKFGKRNRWGHCSSDFKKAFGEDRSEARLHWKYNQLRRKESFYVDKCSSPPSSPAVTQGIAGTPPTLTPAAGDSPPANSTRPRYPSRAQNKNSTGASASKTDIEKAGSPTTAATKKRPKRVYVLWSKEQERWLLHCVEEGFEGMELNEFDWEIVAKAFYEQWGVKRKATGLMVKWGRLTANGKKRGAANDMTKYVEGEATEGEATDNEASSEDYEIPLDAYSTDDE